METYFHNDPRIHEWIDQITEKIFTVCLLKGVDAETEFNKGCQIVTKLTMLLQSISIFPAEYLEDGVKQLIDQQLPDVKIINNFPSFNDIKNRMLNDGFAKAIKTQTNERITNSTNSLESTTRVMINAENVAFANPEIIDAGIPASQVEENNDENLSERVTTVFAPLIGTSPNHLEAEQEIERERNQDIEQEMDQELLDTRNVRLAPEKQTDDPQEEPFLAKTTTKDELMTVSSLPETKEEALNPTNRSVEEERLERVLLTIYPNKLIHWNIKVANQLVYAKIEDLLVCLHDPDNLCNIKKMNQQGWKVFVCRYDDLMFPRRLERGLHQVLRESKKKLPVN